MMYVCPVVVFLCGYTRPVDILYRIVLYCIVSYLWADNVVPLKGSKKKKKMILRALARSALVTKTAALGAPRPNVTYHVYRHASALVGRKQRQNRQRHIAHAKRASRTLSELVVVARCRGSSPVPYPPEVDPSSLVLSHAPGAILGRRRDCQCSSPVVVPLCFTTCRCQRTLPSITCSSSDCLSCSRSIARFLARRAHNSRPPRGQSSPLVLWARNPSFVLKGTAAACG